MSLLVIAKRHLDAIKSEPWRIEAWRRMEAVGLPNRKTETWKYSTLAPLDKIDWKPVPKSAAGEWPTELPVGWTRWLSNIKRDFDVVVQINGRYQQQLSQPGKNLNIGTADSKSYRAHDGFSSMSLAVSEPGVKIESAAGVKGERPLLIFKYQNQDAWASTFNEITVGADGELRVAELFAGFEGRYLRTDFSRVVLGENASLQWLRRQQESAEAYHFNETHVSLPAHSRLQLTTVHSGARWLRGQLMTELDGAGAEAHLHGLTLGSGEQQIDQRVVVAHTAGQTNSGQLFKGVFKDRSKGSMNGKIFIARDAQKVASMQLNHNLLLSPGAEANTKPELEIYADDVKANHGATVGRLDQEKMFYLRSRGLTAALAEKLLSEAFTRDVYMKISDPQLRAFAEGAHGA